MPKILLLQKALIYAVHADKEPKELHDKCGEIKIKVQRNQNHERRHYRQNHTNSNRT